MAGQTSRCSWSETCVRTLYGDKSVVFASVDLGVFSCISRVYLSAVKGEKPVPFLRQLSMISSPVPHFWHTWCCGKRSALPIRCVPHFEQIPSREPGLIMSSWEFISAFMLELKLSIFQFYKWILCLNTRYFKISYHIQNRLILIKCLYP